MSFEQSEADDGREQKDNLERWTFKYFGAHGVPITTLFGGIIMKKQILTICTLALFLCTFSAALAFSAPYSLEIPKNLHQKKIIVVDSVYIGGYDLTIANAEMLRFNTMENALADLRSGKAQAIIYDKKALEYIAAQNSDLMVLEDTFLAQGMVFAITPTKPDLKTAVDAKIKALQTDGQLKDMQKYWFTTTAITGKEPVVLVNIGDDEGDSDIVYGTAANNEPFAFIGTDDKVMGLEIELLDYIAQSMNVQTFVDFYAPSQLLPAVESGKLDMAGGFIADDPRLANVLKSEPYFGGSLGILVLK